MSPRNGSDPSGPPFWATIFGLCVESEIALDEVAPVGSPGSPDLRIIRVSVDEAAARIASATPYSRVAEGDRVWLEILRGEDAYVLRWPEGLDVIAPDDGGSLLVAEHGVVSDSVARLLLGHAISFALPEHGMESFHSSIVELDGEAIMLIGDSGAGKSTLVASLCLAGGRLIADDVAAVTLDADGRPRAVPAGSKVWVAPSIASELGLAEGDAFGRPHKVAAALPLAPEAVPIRRAVFLRKRPDVMDAWTPISGSDGVVALVASLFNPTAKNLSHQKLRFEIIAAIVAHARLVKLVWDPAPARAGAVVAHIKNEPASKTS